MDDATPWAYVETDELGKMMGSVIQRNTNDVVYASRCRNRVATTAPAVPLNKRNQKIQPVWITA